MQSLLCQFNSICCICGNAFAKVRASSVFSRVLHSHITRTRQPNALSRRIASASRRRLSVCFFSQKSMRVVGNLPLGQRWPCQKHPFTMIMVACFLSTMSGVPGNDRSCSRKRRPAAWSIILTRRSGAVSRLRTAAIMRLRVDCVTLSVIAAPIQQSFHSADALMGPSGVMMGGGIPASARNC